MHLNSLPCLLEWCGNRGQSRNDWYTDPLPTGIQVLDVLRTSILHAQNLPPRAEVRRLPHRQRVTLPWQCHWASGSLHLHRLYLWDNPGKDKRQYAAWSVHCQSIFPSWRLFAPKYLDENMNWAGLEMLPLKKGFVADTHWSENILVLDCEVHPRMIRKPHKH